MTRDEMISHAIINLDDTSTQFFTGADFNDAIQDCYDGVVAFCETRETSGKLNLEANKTFYHLPTYFSDFLRIIAIWNNQTNRWMTPVGLKELVRLDDRWELRTGQPYLFWPINNEYVAFFPRVTATVGTLDIFYKRIADTLISTSEPDIPLEHQQLFENYLTFDMLDQIEEYAKSMRYWKQYQVNMNDVKRALNGRLSPDLMLRLKEA